MTADLCAGIEALIGDATIYHLVNGTSSQPEPARFVRVSDLIALLAAHPVQDEGAHGTERIDGHWLVEDVDRCTCAGVDQFGHEAHERGCGTEPLVDLRGLPGWDSLTALIAAPAPVQVTTAEAWEAGWVAGCNDQQYGNEDAEPWTPNPYHADLDPDAACDRGPCHLPLGHKGRCNPGGGAIDTRQETT